MQLLLSYFKKPFFSKSSQESIMDYNSLPKRAPQVPSAAKIPCSILKGDSTYVPEPLMQEEKTTIWYSQVLTPYSYACTTHSFMGPLHKLIKKPPNLEHFFPSFPSCEPLVFKDEPFDLSFTKNRVFRSSPSTNNLPTSSG